MSSETQAASGWRWLENGETIRPGDEFADPALQAVFHKHAALVERMFIADRMQPTRRWLAMAEVRRSWPTQCPCGHIYQELYQFAEPTGQGNIGFAWCGWCRTKTMVKAPVPPVIDKPRSVGGVSVEVFFNGMMIPVFEIVSFLPPLRGVGDIVADTNGHEWTIAARRTVAVTECATWIEYEVRD